MKTEGKKGITWIKFLDYHQIETNGFMTQTFWCSWRKKINKWSSIWCISLLPLNLWTRSTLSTTLIRESADVMRTSDELPGANCSFELIRNWKEHTNLWLKVNTRIKLFQGKTKLSKEQKGKKWFMLFKAECRFGRATKLPENQWFSCD